MKNLIIGSLAVASMSAFSISGNLDGSKYCREALMGGVFGQPVYTGTNCIYFKGGRATDNASTFFGNPPQTFTYEVVDSKIVNVDKNIDSDYTVSGNTLVMKKSGAVLNRVK